MTKPTTISIDNVVYVRQDSLSNTPAETFEGLPYVICRTKDAGVFAGYLAAHEGQEVLLKKARRLWYWEGAASLSQAAEQGFSKPSKCKFPCEVSQIHLLTAIEMLDCTKAAQDSINGVPEWKA